MARKVKVLLKDDIDGSDAQQTVSFALDGAAYEIDLSDENAQALRDTMSPWIAAARRVGRLRRIVDLRTKPRTPRDAAEIRRWAEENGIPVSRRGRIADELRAQYEAAQQSLS